MPGVRQIRKAAQKHNDMRRLESSAEAGNLQAAQAFKEGQRSKTRRTLAMIAAGAALVGVCVKGIEDFGDNFKGAVPHQDIKGKIQNTLSKVTLPNTAILVEGTGSGTAQVNARPESNIPVVGSIFNHTLATLMDMNAYAKREGTVQIASKRNAISLSPVQAPTLVNGKTKSLWQIKARVNAQDLYTTSHMDYAVENGKKQLIPGKGLLAVPTIDGVSKRDGWVTNWADRSFQQACGQALTIDIPAGVEKHVRDEVNETAKLLDTPGHRDSARLLRTLASRHVIVELYEMRRGDNGLVEPHTISPRDVALPEIFNPVKVANEIHAAKGNVHFETGVKDCTFTGDAMKQQLQILGTPNQTPGV
jgi:hypothetical protein